MIAHSLCAVPAHWAMVTQINCAIVEDRVYSEAKLALLSRFQYCSVVWHHSSAPNAHYIEKIQEGALKCVFSNHTAAFLNKARLPSFEVGIQMNIAFQTFKNLNHVNCLAPTDWKALSHPQFKEFWRYPENSSHEKGATWNNFLLFFGP